MTIETSPQIDIIRGDGVTINFTFTDDDDLAVDLTGKTLFFTAKPDLSDDTDDSEAVIEKSTSVHTNAAGGLSQLILTAADTQDLEPGFYFWDCQLKGAATDPTSTIYGKLRVWADITRRTT